MRSEAYGSNKREMGTDRQTETDEREPETNTERERERMSQGKRETDS